MPPAAWDRHDRRSAVYQCPMTIPSSSVPELRSRLLGWYDAQKRELPWRGDASAAGDDPEAPYRVWVSEVMLQQTRVEAVRPYFERWTERFPTLASLSSAALDEVLKAWEGLGYYSRARNLHRAARQVTERHGGRVPADPEAFRALPGVGRYTAGAVMSIAFGLPEPVVDGNVRRVVARWMDVGEPRERDLWSVASALVAGERPGDLNQALMELGATVCTPRAPRCDRCPVWEGCLARAAGTQEQRPTPRRRGPLPHERTAVAIATRGERLLLARRPVDSRLGGMWEFPSTLMRSGESSAAAAERALTEGLGLPATATAAVGSVDHAFTHVRVTYDAIRCRPGDGEPRPILYDSVVWAAPDELAALALPAAQRKLAALVRAAP